MKYDPNLHHRRSIRWRDYDYSWPGVYFVTLVVRRRLCVFGEVHDGQLQMNAAGEMITAQGFDLATRFPFC